ncbi:MAG: PAS domain S-box protein [Proteobacteria bacterium]|nr:PAS domain S-box protein [Pseudomonadota bacterium]
MELKKLLKDNKNYIINEWVRRLKSEISYNYSKRPINELKINVIKAFNANYHALVHNNIKYINSFIEEIGKIRLQSGFSLSEVQKAFELYRSILLPIIYEKIDKEKTFNIIEKLNKHLSYTIHSFSDYYQTLSENEIRNYAQKLEIKIKERTKELAESEEKYRILVEEINDGYFITNEKIIFANKTFCKMHGYTLNEILGSTYLSLISEESSKEIDEILKNLLNNNSNKESFFYLRKHKSGKLLPTETKIKIINYQGEKVIAGICRDVTERVENEKKFRDSERLAYIGQLTSCLAHELKNPLSSIKMNIQILLQKLNLEGYDKRRLEIVGDEVIRLEKILTEILDFAKPINLELSLVNINNIIRSSLEFLDLRFKEKDIKLRLKLSNNIPKILLDRDKIEQAILNILLNSIDALSETGKGVINIDTRKFRNNFVIIQIKDNGHGLEENDLPNIFEPFFTKKRKGTGLGLTNVKKIIEAHGGLVKALLRKKGLEIQLKLPIRR